MNGFVASFRSIHMYPPCARQTNAGGAPLFFSSDVLNANSITAGFHQDDAEIWRQIADLELWGSERSITAPASTKSESARFGEFQWHINDVIVSRDVPPSSNSQEHTIYNMPNGSSGSRSKHNTVSNSSIFRPDAVLIPGMSLTDCVLESSDRVLFHVHRAVLSTVSSNGFDAILHEFVQPLKVPETSSFLNLILHAIYNLPYTASNSSFEFLVSAVDRMSVYGLEPKRFLEPRKVLFMTLYAHAPQKPIELYAFAGHHGLQALAEVTSGHLLSFDLFLLTHEMVDRMGARYLLRLFALHRGRIATLKAILIVPPDIHDNCSDVSKCVDIGNLHNTWAHAAVALTQYAKPDLSPQLLASSMWMYSKRLRCDLCKKQFKCTVDTAAEKWASVKATI